MSRRPPLAALALAGALLGGCNAELGARGGASWVSPRAPSAAQVHGVWVGRAAVSAVYDPLGKVFNRDGILLGGELEGRGESVAGSRFTTGLSVGYARQPQLRPGALGWEVHADVGSPIRRSTLFADGSFYAGGAGALAIWISKRHQLADVNVGQWWLSDGLELVFLGSTRVHVDSPYAAAARSLRVEATAGAALRLRFMSDFF
jgi:hypothetical protein